MTVIDIGPLSLAGAAALVLLNAVLSIWLRLGLGKQLLVASARTIVQLAVLGYVLVPIFAWEAPWGVLGICVAMVILAAREAMRRTRRGYRGVALATFASLLLGAGLTAVLATAVFIGVDPWWRPQYLIPLMGMILGNSLTGISLGIDRILELLDERSDRVEVLLSLGATRWEAARPAAAEALRAALIPILNSMSVVGVVTIPGMMTGQILGGTPPDIAARYQILIMFLIAAATAAGAAGAILWSTRTLFDEDHRLRRDRLTDRG